MDRASDCAEKVAIYGDCSVIALFSIMQRILYVTFHPFYPEVSGGAELSTHSLLVGLHRRGWDVTVLCGTSSDQQMKHASHLSPTVLHDQTLDYPCFRCLPNTALSDLFVAVSVLKPSAVVGGHTARILPFLEGCGARHVPTFYYARTIDRFPPFFSLPSTILPIANASVTAKHLAQYSNHDIPIIYPIIDPHLYRAGRRDGQYITFINPIREKGVDIALAVAREMLDRPFLFVQGGWTYTSTQTSTDNTYGLPNITPLSFQSDMRSVYAMTKVLFMPSQFEETAGRVIIEAHLNGIPVVASNVCGIPDQIGAGGIVVAPKDDVNAYAAALRALITNEPLYRELAKNSIENSRRSEFNPDRQIDSFMKYVEAATVMRH
jgi:glycosyltransferase involved in cell wall biosynthesis